MPQARHCPSCSREQPGTWRCARCGALLETQGYRVESLLGMTPKSRVYRVRRGRDVLALKELPFATAPDIKTIDLFEREGALLKALSHPRIPKFIDAFTDGEGPDLRLYLAQTFIPGVDLEKRLAEHHYDEGEAREVLAELLEVLHYLHTRSPQLLHRDIKPGNILRTPQGEHVLVDFGSVRSRGRAASGRSTIAGTFGYMPPEQLARQADERSDLYALGVTVIRLLSRRAVEELHSPELTIDFRAYVNVSVEMMDFLEQLVARSPQARFKSAQAALRALALLPRVASGQPLDEAPIGPTQVVPIHAAKPRLRLKPVETGGDPEGARVVRINASGVRWLTSRSAAVVHAPDAAPWALHAGTLILGLHPGYAYQVGRDPGMDIPLAEGSPRFDTVSRKHARLTVTRAGLVIEDLGSSNGTYVGDARVAVPAAGVTLRIPATLWFGKYACAAVPRASTGPHWDSRTWFFPPCFACGRPSRFTQGTEKLHRWVCDLHKNR